ncbi:MAG: acyl-CoA thioesterase [Chloroflexi bacterium]|nr:acyl-CoA thioesterase [Chloroflexota bacterium]
MPDTLPPRPVSASRGTLSQVMGPEHAHAYGNVHGGWLMKLVDEAGGQASMRHARQLVVTVAMDNMTFKQPVHIGDLVTLRAELTYAGRTSMEVRVEVTAENPIVGQVTHTNTAYLVYIAIDEQGRPTPVPPLIPETELERERMERGRQRQEARRGKRQ